MSSNHNGNFMSARKQTELDKRRICSFDLRSAGPAPNCTLSPSDVSRTILVTELLINPFWMVHHHSLSPLGVTFRCVRGLAL